jgi:hypothetical protein
MRCPLFKYAERRSRLFRNSSPHKRVNQVNQKDGEHVTRSSRSRLASEWLSFRLPDRRTRKQRTRDIAGIAGSANALNRGIGEIYRAGF